MSTSKRITIAAAVLALFAAQAACRAEEAIPESSAQAADATAAPAKQWVWLAKQGVYGYGYQIQDGPHKGLWRIDPDSKRTPEEVSPPAEDPYGFAAELNRYRVSAGL